MNDDNKPYLVLISIHGLIRGYDLELGRDADTGGQTKYVVELARALGTHPAVGRVDLLTRLVADPAVSPDYAKPVEALAANVQIIRIPCGDDGYLPKEQLWDFLDSFADSALAYLKQQPHLPAIIHSHYADAGYVGTRLSHQLGIPLVFTGLYIPKVEHFLEARLFNDAFVLLQEKLGVPRGSLRATFLIETLPAAFQMEEILYELREHAAGLNVGRWDKIFSDIKVLKNHPDRVLADRASIGLNRPWMKAYALRLIQICHQRGAAAIGGMAAFTPGRTAELRQHQTSKVLADKQFENSLGHDGCWVSHPYFIGPALSAFPQDHQLGVLHPELDRYPDLLPQATPPRTEAGLRTNCRVGIAYLEGWRRDLGCVAWDNLMEDLATLEISRAQTWQWRRHAAELEDGRRVDAALVREIFEQELAQICQELAEEGNLAPAALEARQKAFAAAKEEAVTLFLAEEFAPFLSLASDLA